MSSTLIQHSYFKNTYSFSGGQWTLAGHSRALERTGFLLSGKGRITIFEIFMINLMMHN
jgi:hypothetical protein